MPRSQFFLNTGVGSPIEIASMLGGTLNGDQIYFSPNITAVYCDNEVLIIPPGRHFSNILAKARKTCFLKQVQSDLPTLYQ
jgi:hypothetical protein